MEFWQLVRIVRRSWKLIGILVAVCVVFSLFLNLTKVTLYDTAALIRVSFSTTNPVEGQPDYETKSTLFSSIIEAATSDGILRSVAQKYGVNADIKSLRQSIKVLQVEKSEFIKISVTAPSEKAAVGIANDLADYTRQASNDRWINQLKGMIDYNQKQLKAAQTNYDTAVQGYDEAKKRYSDLDAKLQQEDIDQRQQQINEANNAVIQAQDDYSKANNTIPKDQAAIELAKGKLDRAQKTLDALQQAANAPLDAVKEQQRQAELNQTSGLTDAFNKRQAAKSRIDDLQGQLDLQNSMLQFPDMHAASVTVVERPDKAFPQSSQLPLFVGGAVAVALVLGVVLAVLINYLDRGLSSVAAARDIYRQPVLAGIPMFRPGQNKSKLAKLNLKKGKGKEDTSALPEQLSAEELTGLPDYAMEGFRMLANSIVARHHDEIPSQVAVPVHASLPAGTELVTGSENGKTNGNGNGLALAELSEVNSLALDGGVINHPLGLLVTANGVGAGKTTVVANLGTAFAEAGYRTLLIDCNRRNPALLTSFGIDDGSGKGKKKKKDKDQTEQFVAEPGRVYNTEYPELDLLPYSSLPVQASGVVRLADMATMLQKLEGDYQLMICDTPALNEASDAMGLTQHFPNVLFVVDGRNAKVEQDQEKLHSLMVGNTALEGLVVNWMQKQN
jgi:Mrp family chromosome partitioning ATPase/capsular polysaccharide biosynthesis protein